MDQFCVLEPGKTLSSVTVNENSTVLRDHLLGRENVIDDLDRSVRARTRLSGMDVHVRLVKNGSGGTLAPSLAVAWAASGVGTVVGALAGSAADAAGVVDPYLTSPVPDGDYFYIVVYGPTKLTVSAALSAGAGIACSGSGKVGAVSTNLSKGRMLEASTADGQIKRAFVNFRLV